MDLYEFTIKGNSFSGLLGSYELTRHAFEQLYVKEDDLVDVNGEFNVQWDGDIPIVMIETCIASNDGHYVACNSYVVDYIRDLIQSTISTAWNDEVRDINEETAYYENQDYDVYHLSDDEG